ncbi:MAG: DUF1566 domain-containing protein [Sandaracinaceae bacterium]|nr:DUF1566 domain-containing protein [Sandaracinaceae bacterium]
MRRAFVIAWLCLAPGCDGPLDPDQGTMDGGVRHDASMGADVGTDASMDADVGGDASVDANAPDASEDAGALDASGDGGSYDGGPDDASSDAGPSDLGVGDGALADMGADVCAAPSRCAGTDATSGVSYAYGCEALTFPAYRCEGLDVEWPVNDASRFDVARYQVDVGADTIDGSEDDVVFDTLTGLEWQRAPSPTNQSWSDGATSCADLAIAGDGWRLPEQVELESLVDVRTPPPAIDTSAFPGTPAARFWSASPFVGAAGEIWFTNFTNGFTDTATAATTMRVRCVRRATAPSRPASLASRFVTTDTTATDGITGLEWARATASPRSWAAAVDHCTSLGGRRLPTRAELLSLVTRTATGPAIDQDAFPTTALDWFWTASSSVDDTRAHIVNFGSGLTSQSLKTELVRVRCVH